MSDAYTIKCEPLEIHRIDGEFVNEVNLAYTYTYLDYISLAKELVLYKWNKKLINKLVNDKLSDTIILIKYDYYFIKLYEYDIITWFIMDGRLHICLYTSYPYYWDYYNSIEIFGYTIDADLCSKWCKMTKDMTIDDLDEMKKILILLYM
jgi:hypothetical protein